MPSIETDPAYAAKRVNDMHEVARRMDKIIQSSILPEHIKIRARVQKREAERLAVRIDGWVR